MLLVAVMDGNSFSIVFSVISVAMFWKAVDL